MEIWKDCKGYEGLYQVSNLGRVWNVSTQIYLKSFSHKQGYLRVTLKAKNGKYKKELIHRLIALVFIPNPNNYPCVNHKDEDTRNNCIENLEWCTHKYNSNYGNSLKKRGKKVICENVTYDTMIECANNYDIDVKKLYAWLEGRTKTPQKFIELGLRLHKGVN